jgi:aspartate beta-hydroxylase
MMAISSVNSPEVAPTTVQDALDRAVALHGERKVAEAETLYRRALSLDPNHAPALCYLGLLRLEQGGAEESATLLRQAIAQDPSLAEAHAYLGVALQRLGDPSEAEASFVKALSLQPDQPDALCRLGMVPLQQGNAEESATLLRRAVAQSPDAPQPHAFLGAALQQLGSFEEALACHDRALALARTTPKRFRSGGRALQALGRGAEAIESYEAALAKAPGDAQTQLALGTVLESFGRHEEAFVRYGNAAGLDPNLAASLTKAIGDYAQRRPAVAQAGMQRLNNYIGSFLTNQGNARMSAYPGLSATPFPETARLPGALALEERYETIRAEIQGLAAAEFQQEAENLKARGGSWDVLFFYERGRKNEENCARCPTIANLIESHNMVRTLTGLVYVSKLSPGSQVRPHRGPTNMRLRCHLGISIPDGDCGLKVGGETRRWREGRCLVFDDSFEHEAWNLAAAPRTVLIVDFWHPDLTPTEIAFLEGLHRYGAFQADSLGRYWSANAESKSKASSHYD